MKEISIILSEEGDFAIENNIVKTTDGSKFYAELLDEELQLKTFGKINSISNGDVIVGNNIISTGDVSIKNIGGDIFIDTSKSGKIYVNGKLMQEAISGDEKAVEDKSVSEFDISAYAIKSVQVSGIAGLALAKSITTRFVDIDISGQGVVIIDDIIAESFDVDISGQGSVVFENCISNNVRIRVSGQGSVSGKNNSFDSVTTKISGMGSVDLPDVNSL